jgi:hypothetical protein
MPIILYKIADKNLAKSKTCNKIVRAARSGVVCTGSEFMNWFYVTRVVDAKQFGGQMPLKNV